MASHANPAPLHVPAPSMLEIDITYQCGFGCINCNRLTQVAKARPETQMTTSQIDQLVRESLDLRWHWRKLSLMGGEPTLHPDLFEMIEILLVYKRIHQPDLLVQVCTHGAGARTQQVIDDIKRRFPAVYVRNTRKTSRRQASFEAVTVAPQDMPEGASATYRGCWIPSTCGFGLNYAGYHCCAVAGAISRVLGWRSAIRRLRDVTPSSLIAMYSHTCPMCGHHESYPTAASETHSVSWRLALAQYESRACAGHK